MHEALSRGFYRRYGKRAIDLVLGSAALVLVSPLILAAAILVRLRLGSPVFFVEERAGHAGRPFVLRKLRTMTNDVDAAGRPLPDEQRLTSFGRHLRRTSIDELPQLLNVINGDMTLVGPRPLPMRYVARYSTEQARRLDAVPGLTGLAQIRGRNSLSWSDRFALDVWYVDHQSLTLDLRIMLSTAAVVLRGRGISQPGHSTMEEFSR
jgi:lipopolysaccharide/colanic/teichoic acid biosynthesis glycosyltransferase